MFPDDIRRAKNGPWAMHYADRLGLAGQGRDLPERPNSCQPDKELRQWEDASVRYVLANFLQQCALWLCLPIDHADQAKEVAKRATTQVLLHIFPFFVVTLTLGLVDLADYFSFENISRAQS